MYKIACTRKEASCILGSFFGELDLVCERCKGAPDGELLLSTTEGLVFIGDGELTFEGHSAMTGAPALAKITDYGFEFAGDITEITRIREMRCLYSG